MQQMAAVGKDDALGARMADVALVPQGHVLHGGVRVAAQYAGHAGDAFGDDGVLLVGHGRAALLPLGEGFLHLVHVGALEIADLHGHLLQGGADQRQAGQEARMAVALQHLGGHRRDVQPQPLHGLGLHLGIQMHHGAHGSGDLPHRHVCDGGVETLQPLCRAAQ